MNKPKAVILLSGGLDSTTVLHMHKHDYEFQALHIQYGQRHSVEGYYAHDSAEKLGVPFHKYQIPELQWLHGISSLTDNSMSVPVNPADQIGKDPELPSTFVPGRNAIMLSLAASFAYSINADTIFTGYNILDYSGYPDCRPEFCQAIEHALSFALGRKLSIVSPLISMNKQQIKDLADTLYDWRKDTWSCYNPVDKGESIQPCGECDSCKLRGV